MSDISNEAKFNAVRNDYSDETFVLGDRVFPIKDLDYDSYLEFVDLARPIVTTIAASIDLKPLVSGSPNAGDEIQLNFDPSQLDFAELIRLSGKELPRMAWLCCKQSDSRIKIEDVKKLGRRPQYLLEVVLLQVKHNEIIKEFADFFPRIAAGLKMLMPDAEKAMTPIPAEEVTTTPTE